MLLPQSDQPADPALQTAEMFEAMSQRSSLVHLYDVASYILETYEARSHK